MHRSVRRGVFWLIMLGVSLLILAGCGRKDPAIERVKIVLGPDLPTARQRFQTTPQPCEYQPGGPAPVPPAGVLNLIRYRSPAGELAAYVTPDPGDGKRHPAVVWAHGGFGGCPDLHLMVGSDQETPFDDARIEEYYIRSPICFVSTLRVPTFYFEGAKSVYPSAAATWPRGRRRRGNPSPRISSRAATTSRSCHRERN